MIPICATCQREMRCTKTGRAVELISAGAPYQLWQGDEFGCDGCGASIVTGFWKGPIREAHHPDYAAMVACEASNGRVIRVTV